MSSRSSLQQRLSVWVLVGCTAAIRLCGATIGSAESTSALRLERPVGAEGWRLSMAAASNEVVTIQTSSDFKRWDELLVGHGSLDNVADLRVPSPEAAFYRGVARPRSGNDDGKNVIRRDDDAFLSPAGEPWQSQSRWIKFALLLDAPHRVWFQDSTKHTFHYEFGVARLPGFSGMSRAEFDAVTLRTNGQKAVLGAVVFPPTSNIREVGIQLVGMDAYSREQVAGWFATVRAMIQGDPGLQAVYLPTYEQSEVARVHSEWFAARGIPISSAGRWVVGDECYAAGWALGRLVDVPGGEIGAAYADGGLRPDDVLLTDLVPAEVPPLAGIISRVPATPNSHVALLAQSFGIPFVHLSEAAARDRVSGWTNREVMVRAVAQFGGCELTVEAVDGVIDPAIRAAILALKAPPKLELPVKVPSGQIALPADGLRPADSGKVGGKAANFGVLMRRIPTNAPSPAIALTFDLWEGYLDQSWAGGGTLRSAIEARLREFVWPPDMRRLQAALGEVRDWITDEADFSSSQRTEVLKALQDAGFEPARPIRFRSSTNVEDGEQFNGAGLYDSYSGCLADELDDNGAGPSHCDPTEAKERGVFRAIRKVYASFYNDNAYLERLRHGVNEDDVGMAVLVHPSTPDEFEMANGVATLDVFKDGGRYVTGNLIAQAGAVSVANPETTALPESVTIYYSGSNPMLTFERESSLVPLGGRVMAWEKDYRDLAVLLNQSAQTYEAEFPAKKRFKLDFEFKKRAPEGRLVVKQIREVPLPVERTFQPWLVATAGNYQVFQGEHGDIVAHHRLKSDWVFRVGTQGMGDADLGRSPYLGIQGSWFEGTQRTTHAGAPADWPGYQYRRGAEFLTDGWVWGEGNGRREWNLRTYRSGPTSSREGPLVTLADLRLELTAKYAAPQPTLGYRPEDGSFGPTTTLEETVWLGPVTPVTRESVRQERTIQVAGVKVFTAFWWPVPPKGVVAGYTAPVQAWIETRITGLASREIVLRSPWAQTYHPGHHNFYEEFLFEPGLDPEVPEDIRAELAAKNVKAIVLGAPNQDFGDRIGYLWGWDGAFRKM